MSIEDIEKDIVKKLRALGYSIHKEFTIYGLLSEYELFINECKNGYWDTIFEYYNDVMVREEIADVIAILQERKQGYDFINKVNELDERFRGLLINKDKSIWGEKYNKSKKDKNWWYWGFPRNPRYDFLEDLKAGGFLQ